MYGSYTLLYGTVQMATRKLIERIADDGRATADGARPLSRADWLGGALTLLVDEGIDAVRITRLAEALAVSRGSFYWHFRDRSDLLDGLVAVWRAKNTAAVLDAVNGAESLTDGIFRLFDAWLDPDRFDPRLDLAMRDWARRTADIRAAVDGADRARVDAITGLFRRFGYGLPEAFIRARILYFTQVGYYALGVDEPLAERFGYLEAYYEGFTGRTLDPGLAAAYRARHSAARPERGAGND
jgi:AcrR family transcriptional regulator